MQGRKKRTVLAWPLRSPANRYPETLYMHLPNVDAHDFVAGRSGLKAIFRRKYDVFHIHWLERAFWRGGRIAVLKAVAATLCAAALLRSEERRVGQECVSRCGSGRWPCHKK